MSRRAIVIVIVAAAIGMVSYLSAILLILHTERDGYRANCLHTNQGMHLILDKPIKQGIANSRATLRSTTASSLDKTKAQATLTASLEFEGRVNAAFSREACNWPPVSLAPLLTAPSSTTTTGG
jgi:hypothetical protein